MNLETRRKLIELAQALSTQKAAWFDELLARVPETVINTLIHNNADVPGSAGYYKDLGKRFGVNNLTATCHDEAMTLIRNERLIEAIKCVRAHTDAGLKPAKDLVEYMLNNYPNMPRRPQW